MASPFPLVPSPSRRASHARARTDCAGPRWPPGSPCRVSSRSAQPSASWPPDQAICHPTHPAPSARAAGPCRPHPPARTGRVRAGLSSQHQWRYASARRASSSSPLCILYFHYSDFTCDEERLCQTDRAFPVPLTASVSATDKPRVYLFYFAAFAALSAWSFGPMMRL